MPSSSVFRLFQHIMILFFCPRILVLCIRKRDIYRYFINPVFSEHPAFSSFLKIGRSGSFPSLPPHCANPTSFSLIFCLLISFRFQIIVIVSYRNVVILCISSSNIILKRFDPFHSGTQCSILQSFCNMHKRLMTFWIVLNIKLHMYFSKCFIIMKPIKNILSIFYKAISAIGTLLAYI